MLKPPDESIGRRLVSRLTENLKDGHKKLDFMMSFVIFLASIVELLSWRMQTKATAVVLDAGDGYLLFWYPFLSTLTIWIFSWFFLVKILRYRACIYSQLVSIIYWLVQTINVSAFVFQYDIDLYDRVVYPMLLCVIVLITIIKLIRWFISKQR